MMMMRSIASEEVTFILHYITLHDDDDSKEFSTNFNFCSFSFMSLPIKRNGSYSRQQIAYIYVGTSWNFSSIFYFFDIVKCNGVGLGPIILQLFLQVLFLTPDPA